MTEYYKTEEYKKQLKSANKFVVQTIEKFNAEYPFDKCFRIFQEVCKEEFNLNIILKSKSEIDDWRSNNRAYIDHQSSVTEHRNMQMFKSKNQMYYFLKSKESMIVGGNDNG